MSDTLVTLFSIRSATKICDFRNQDFGILIPTYESLKLFFYCLGLELSNGLQENWIPNWLQLWGTKVVRTKLNQRNCCFCNVLEGQYNGTSCWQPISFLTMDQCWSRCWNSAKIIAQLTSQLVEKQVLKNRKILSDPKIMKIWNPKFQLDVSMLKFHPLLVSTILSRKKLAILH